MNLPANRRTPLQARSNQTVEEILDAASTLLGRIPFEEITTSRVAQEAGISVGALYRFYSGRQEIFDAIAVRELEAFRAEIARAFTARQLIFSPRKSLGRVLDSYVSFLDSRDVYKRQVYCYGRAAVRRAWRRAFSACWAQSTRISPC